MRDRKKRNIIIGSLCCLLVFMGIGYALLSQTLNINGIANLTGKWKIYIDSITVKEVGGSAKSNQAEVTEDKLTANFDVELLKPGDYVEYDVVVKNEGTINAVLRELIPNIESNNMDILLTHSIIQGQILKAESETKFTLKIRFDERATEIVSGGQTSFDIQMVYEQYDGDATGIDPTLAPVTANDCFKIDDNGVITDYDYSCGTYVTVPAVVNGTTVTSISNLAFTIGDLIAYEGDEAMLLVAETEEAYNKIYEFAELQGAPVEQISQMLFLKGRDQLPDTTGLFSVHTTADSFLNTMQNEEEIVLATSKVEYLDLSQANGLKKIESGAFLSNPSESMLNYLNIDKTKIEEIGSGGVMFANLNFLTITTDMYNLIRDKITATIDTLRIYPGESTEIPNQSCGYVNNKITVNNLILENGITKIGDCAFMGNENPHEAYGAWNVKKVELPESLTSIGNDAFYYSRITDVALPSNLKTIGEGAFRHTDITSITIPASVERIEKYAFSTGSSHYLELKSLKFEENSKIIYIGNYAFAYNDLTEVDFSPIMQKFELGDEVFPSNNITSVAIDDVKLGIRSFGSNLKSLELIGNIEFSDNISNGWCVTLDLNDLKIKSDTLQEIPEYAFDFDIEAPATIEFLNKAGTEVNSSIKTIEEYAFSGSSPTTIILPTTLENIGDGVFYHANPTTLVMSPVIKTIGADAFRSLRIDSLTIPSTVESIGNNAFSSMPATSTITVNKAEGSFTTVSGWNGDAKVIYQP